MNNEIVAWVRQLGSTKSETANAVATDDAGNVYLAGYTLGQLEAGKQVGKADIWVAKYDGAGNQQWLKQLGSTAAEGARTLATDGAGNVYLAGLTKGALEAGKQVSKGDIWLAQYDGAGNQQWLKQLGSTRFEAANAVVTDGAGNVYLAGYTLGELEAGKRVRKADIWVAKYDGAGNQQWLKQLGSTAVEGARTLATDGAGNVYLAGRTEGELEAGKQVGKSDIWLAKYDGAGNQQWLKQLGSTEYDETAALATDVAGNVYLAGYTKGELEAGKHVGKADIWLAKYDGTGNQQWLKQLGSAEDDSARGLATDGVGNVYLAGYTEGELEAGKHVGKADIWVAKYDGAGNQQWLKQLGSTESDYASALATDAAGNVYLVGGTEGELEAGKQVGKADIWVAKIPAEKNGTTDEPSAGIEEKLQNISTSLSTILAKQDETNAHLQEMQDGTNQQLQSISEALAAFLAKCDIIEMQIQTINDLLATLLEKQEGTDEQLQEIRELLLEVIKEPPVIPRVTAGQLAAYEFNEGNGTIVRDIIQAGPSLDLHIADPASVRWIAGGGLSIDAETLLASEEPAAKIIKKVKNSNEITVEAWVKPANTTQEGPARIVSISKDTRQRNLTLGQGRWDDQPPAVYDVRLRTTADGISLNGMPSLTTPNGIATTQLTHLVYTRDSQGEAKIYVDGDEHACKTGSGDLSNWDKNYKLMLANEATGKRAWLGEYYWLAIFDRALTAAEVQQNFEAGLGHVGMG